MKRRGFTRLLAGAAIVPSAALAEGNAEGSKVGYVYTGPRQIAAARVDAVVSGIRASGHRLPQVEMVVRITDGDPAKLAPMIAEVIGKNVSVFLANGPAALRAAQAVSKTLPIVAIDFETDPVVAGFAQSIARPGGNVTGVFLDFPNFAGKWIELLLECKPKLTRIAVMWDPSTGPVQVDAVTKATAPLNIQTDLLETKVRADYTGAFAVAKDRGAGAVIVLSSPLVPASVKDLAELSIHHQLPTITMFSEFPRTGGLFSYGPNLIEFDQADRYDGRQGARGNDASQPADRAADQVRNGRQPQGGRGAGHHDSTVGPSARRRGDRVRRREVIASIAVAASLPTVALAQEAGRIYRIGTVITVPLTDSTIATVLEELKGLGFVEGKNLIVDPRGLSLRPDQMVVAARQLAEAKVDLFLTGGGSATKAAQAASSTIPILAIADDMVGEGLVGSLANRSGNTTGISILAAELDGKRQELLIELLPNSKKMAMLVDATSERLATLQTRARGSGVEVAILPIAKPDDVEPTLKQAKVDGAAAINIPASPFLFAMRQRIFATATALGLGTMYQWTEGIREGALAAYGPSLDETFRQRGRQAAKLLRGTKPTDLPVEQPTTVKLAINLKLAGQLGIPVPPALLQRADEVIE